MNTTKLRIWNDHSRNNAVQAVMLAPVDLGQKWQLTLERTDNKRTLSQNSLQHKWYGELADFCGVSHSQMKEDLIAEFAPLVESKVAPGKMRSKRTSEMDKQECATYMTQIQALASEMGIYLTNPDDIGRE